MPVELSDRQRRLLDAVLILGVVALGFVVVGEVAGVLTFFSDVVLVFFLAWLLAFAILPLINLVKRIVPGIPDLAAVILVYLVVVGLLVGIVVQVSAALAPSITQLPTDKGLYAQLVQLLTDIQHRLVALGFRVDLVGQAATIWDSLNEWAGQLGGALQEVAVASIGVIGNILIVTILSVYLVIDREDALAFVYRLVPPSQTSTARLVQSSVGRSFGGFLRTQLVMGVVFGVLAAAVNIGFGLQYGGVTAVAAGILHAIPFFGPFVSWSPPVIVAALTGSPVLPILIVMVIGWFVVMNIIQPRVMANSVGIHPVMVLVSVLIGLKLQGVVGAIFAVPVAAVISAFFFFYLERSPSGGPRDVASRAARRIEEREGRSVRVPTAPVVAPGSPADAASLSVSGGAAAVAPTAARGGLTGSASRFARRGGTASASQVKPTDDSPT